MVQSVKCNVDCLSPYFWHFATHAIYNMCTLQNVHFACYNVQDAICIQPARQISQMNQLNRSTSQTTWMDQFSTFEVFASLHIQFAHCRSCRVRQRPFQFFNHEFQCSNLQFLNSFQESNFQQKLVNSYQVNSFFLLAS